MVDVDVSRLLATDVIEGQLRAGLVERRWLLERVESALADDGCRCLLLTAQPGWGKTAFSAWFLHQRPDTLRYFIRQDSRRPLNSGGARAFLTAIGHQLATRRPELFTSDDVSISVRQTVRRVSETGEVVGARIGQLVASPFRAVAVRVVQEADDVSGRLLGVDLEHVVGDERLIPLPDLQDLALFDPAKALVGLEPEARIVILVDGLDELRYQLGTETMLDWLSASPEPPANVRLVLTARPDDVLLDPLRRRQAGWLRELSLDDVGEEVTADLTEYARRAVSAPAVHKLMVRRQQDAEAVVRSVVSAASGNFLYLRTLFSAIEHVATEADAGDAAAAAAARRLDGLLLLGELPHELDDLYAFLLTLLRQEVGREHLSVAGDELGQDILLPAWDALYRPILGMLGVAREPVNAAQIGLLAGVRGDEGMMMFAIGRIRPFLLQQAGKYRLFHATMQAFLTSAATARDHPEFAVSSAAWHARVAGNALRHHQRDWASAIDGYALAHIVAHLTSAIKPGGSPGQLEPATTELSRLLTSLDFVTEKVKRLGVDELLADFRDGRSVVSSTRVGELERLCELEVHHLRLASRAGSGISTTQQLHLRAGALGMTWVQDAITELGRGDTGIFVQRLWSQRAESQDLRMTLTGHTEWVTGTVLSSDGACLVTMSPDWTARLWMTATGRTLRILRNDAEFRCAAIDASSRWAVLGDDAGRITFWDLDSGESRVLPVGHKDSIVALAIVLDGQHVVSGCRDGTLKLWAAITGEVRREVGGLGVIRDVAGGRAASRVAVAVDGPLVVWDLQSGQISRPDEPGGGITALAATADGQRVVSGSDGGLGEVWALHPPGRVGQFAGPPNTYDIAVTPEGRYAVAVAVGVGHVIDIAADRAVQRLDGHAVNVFSVDLSGDGRTVVTGGQDRTARIWNLRPEQGTDPPADPVAHRSQVNAVACTPNGDRVASVSQDWTLKIWDGSSGALLHTCPHAGWAQSLTLSDDGRYALTGALTQLYAWDVDNGQLAFRRSVPNVDGIRSLVRSPDNRAFWLGSAQGDLYQLLDGDWEPRGPLAGHTAAVNMLAMSPAGDLIASASQDRTVRIWSLSAFDNRVLAHNAPVFAVCFTRDGQSVVSGGDDGVIRIWSLASGEDAGCIEAHDGWVLGLAPCPDGRHLVSASEDGTMAIWDLTSRRLRSRVGLETVLWCVSQIADDMHVAIGDLGGGVQLLHIDGLQR